MPMSTCWRLLAPLLAILAIASSEPAGAYGSSHRADACERGQALKIAYLRCETQAQDGSLSGSGIAECSEIYETLKHLVFHGSFAALRAWYDGAKELGEASSRADGMTSP